MENATKIFLQSMLLLALACKMVTAAGINSLQNTMDAQSARTFFLQTSVTVSEETVLTMRKFRECKYELSAQEHVACVNPICVMTILSGHRNAKFGRTRVNAQETRRSCSSTVAKHVDSAP